MQVLPLQDLIELLEADQAKAPEHHRKGGLLELGLLKAQAQCVLAKPKRAAVSYTHLTLPTICSV